MTQSWTTMGPCLNLAGFLMVALMVLSLWAPITLAHIGNASLSYPWGRAPQILVARRMRLVLFYSVFFC
jgi:hypothetical protein